MPIAREAASTKLHASMRSPKATATAAGTSMARPTPYTTREV